jgi:hypothetical protein
MVGGYTEGEEESGHSPPVLFFPLALVHAPIRLPHVSHNTQSLISTAYMRVR